MIQKFLAMQKIILKLERDQTRLLEMCFFPYLERVCLSKICNATTEDERLIYQLVDCVFDDIRKMVARKLLTESRRFTFKLTKAQAITLYKLLLAFPIAADQVYMIYMRRQITDTIHKQLIQPQHEAKEPLPA